MPAAAPLLAAAHLMEGFVSFFRGRHPIFYGVMAFLVLFGALVEQNIRLTFALDDLHRRVTRNGISLENHVDRRLEEIQQNCISTTHSHVGQLAKHVEAISLHVEQLSTNFGGSIKEIQEKELSPLVKRMDYAASQNLIRREENALLHLRFSEELSKIQSIMADLNKQVTHLQRMVETTPDVDAKLSEEEIQKVTQIIVKHVETFMTTYTEDLLEQVQELASSATLSTLRTHMHTVASSPTTKAGSIPSPRLSIPDKACDILACGVVAGKAKYSWYPFNASLLAFEFTRTSNGEMHPSAWDLELMTDVQLDQFRSVETLLLTMTNVGHEIVNVSDCEHFDFWTGSGSGSSLFHPGIPSMDCAVLMKIGVPFGWRAMSKLTKLLIRNRVGNIQVKIIMAATHAMFEQQERWIQDNERKDQESGDAETIVALQKKIMSQFSNNLHLLVSFLVSFHEMNPADRVADMITISFVGSQETGGVLDLKYYKDVDLYFSSPDMQQLVNFCTTKQINLMIRREDSMLSTSMLLYELVHSPKPMAASTTSGSASVDPTTIKMEVGQWFSKLSPIMRARVKPMKGKHAREVVLLEDGEIEEEEDMDADYDNDDDDDDDDDEIDEVNDGCDIDSKCVEEGDRKGHSIFDDDQDFMQSLEFEEWMETKLSAVCVHPRQSYKESAV